MHFSVKCGCSRKSDPLWKAITGRLPTLPQFWRNFPACRLSGTPCHNRSCGLENQNWNFGLVSFFLRFLLLSFVFGNSERKHVLAKTDKAADTNGSLTGEGNLFLFLLYFLLVCERCVSCRFHAMRSVWVVLFLTASRIPNRFHKTSSKSMPRFEPHSNATVVHTRWARSVCGSEAQQEPIFNQTNGCWMWITRAQYTNN